MVTALLANIVVTLLLTGLIWVIQVVHYPSFSFAEKHDFSNFMSFHITRITYLVAPLMLLELTIAIYMVVYIDQRLMWLNLLVIILIWLNTALLNMPCHNKLLNSYNKQVIKRLVITNWPRTMLWSLKAVLSIYFFTFQMK